METTSTPAVNTSVLPQAFHAHLHPGRRLKKLLRPNGRRVHIASTPEEHIRLTRYVSLNYMFSSRKTDSIALHQARSNSSMNNEALTLKRLQYSTECRTG